MDVISCPVCGSKEFYEIEQIQGRTPCKFEKEGNEVVIEHAGSTEFIKDMASSISLGFQCANEKCAFFIHPQEVNKLARL